MVQLSHPHMTTGKTIGLTKWTFVGKVMSLFFNTLSRIVIAFLPRSKRLWKEIITNLDSILKTRDIILMIKVHIVKAMAFPVVMYECGCSKRRLSTKELTLSNCGAGEDS